MGRRVDADELVGAAEIAARLGVKRLQVVHDWRRRHSGFPRPVATVSRTLIWYWPDVRRWAANTGRLKGRANGRANPAHTGEAVARAARERSEEERDDTAAT